MSVKAIGTKNESGSLFIETGGITKRLRKGIRQSHGILPVLAFFAIWEILSRTGIIDPLFLPSFSGTATTLINLLVSGKLLVHIGASLQRSLIGFGFAVLVGVPLGFLIGWYNKFEEYIDLLLQGLRNTSTFALLPIFLLFLGLGETSKIAIVFYGALWNPLINTISGVKNVDPIYIKAAKSLGLSDRDIFRKIILPASMPSIVSGARLGAKTAIMVVIAAEMIGAKTGLGFFVQGAQFNFMIPEMYAGILTLSILGVILNYFLLWIEKKATYWKGGIDRAIIQ
ncbi:MAG TPA: ABC transporter permease [Bacillota bacterium]|nr:ABC transporter permease [Bacillota bacterium]